MAHESATETKAEGQGDKISGNVKEAVGGVTGDRSLERQGEREQDRGALKKAWGNIKSIFTKH